jgi:hypothetical protein
MSGAVREPNFFLVGASRAGTTSLWQYLVQHPDIFMPRKNMAQKEPSHFCEIAPKWALNYRDRQRYLDLFSAAGASTAVGEASTPYLVAPEAPGRIREAFPNAKIIIVLRNPTARAFSLYRYLCLIGAEWLTTFEKALAAEEDRMHDGRFTLDNPVWYGLYQYFHSGLYSTQVRRYLDAFPPSQVAVVLSDDLDRDPVGTAQGLYRFLNVDPSFSPSTKKMNGSQFPLSVGLQYLMFSKSNRNDDAGPIGWAAAGIFNTNLALGRYWRRPMKAETAARLVGAYADDVKKTASLIHRNLDAWLLQENAHAS